MTEKQRNMTSIYLICDNKILLLFRKGSRVADNLWVGSAGGHFEKDELNDAEACVLREMQEELSISENMIDNLSFRYVTLRRTKGELRQNYYFFADLANGTNMKLESNEGTLKWFSFKETKNAEMPLTAKYVIEHYLNTGIYNNATYCGIANNDGVIFVELSET